MVTVKPLVRLALAAWTMLESRMTPWFTMLCSTVGETSAVRRSRRPVLVKLPLSSNPVPLVTRKVPWFTTSPLRVSFTPQSDWTVP